MPRQSLKLFGFFFKVLGIALVVSQCANAQEVDWRVFGFGEDDVSVYSAPDIVRTPDSVRVWTKNIKIKTSTITEALKDKKVVEALKGRIAASYAPPFAVFSKMPVEQAMSVLAVEELVNEDRAGQVQYMALVEVDCKVQRLHQLQITNFDKTGKTVRTDTVPRDWQFVAPQTQGQMLVRLICDPHVTAPENTPNQQTPGTR